MFARLKILSIYEDITVLLSKILLIKNESIMKKISYSTFTRTRHNVTKRTELSKTITNTITTINFNHKIN